MPEPGVAQVEQQQGKPIKGKTIVDTPNLQAGVTRQAGIEGVYQPQGFKEPQDKAVTPRAKEPVLVPQGYLEQMRAAQEREDRVTNPYVAGVRDVGEFLSDAGVTVDNIGDYLPAVGISLPPRYEQQTDAQYMQGVAALIFENTRHTLFGNKTVAPEGGSTEGLGFWKRMGLRMQMRQTRHEIREWKDRMDTTREAVHEAKITLDLRPGDERGANRMELRMDPHALATLGVHGLDGLRALVARTREGELINPIEDIAKGLLRFKGIGENAQAEELPTVGGDEQDNLDKTNFIGKIGAAIKENLTPDAIGKRVRDTVKATLDATKLDPKLAKYIVGLDTHLSQAVESLTGIATQGPEAVFNAREGLLDIQAYRDMVFKITEGKVDVFLLINRQLNKIAGGDDDHPTGLDLYTMLDVSEAMSDAYMVAHPDAALKKLQKIADREKLVHAFNAPVMRTVLRAAYGVARVPARAIGRVFPNLPNFTNLETQGQHDPFNPDQPSVEEMPAGPTEPQWWKFWGDEGRIAKGRSYRAGLRQAKAIPTYLPNEKGAVPSPVNQDRLPAFDTMTTDELLAWYDAQEAAKSTQATARQQEAEQQNNNQANAEAEKERIRQQQEAIRNAEAAVAQAKKTQEQDEATLRGLVIGREARGLRIDPATVAEARRVRDESHVAYENAIRERAGVLASNAQTGEQLWSVINEPLADEGARSLALQRFVPLAQEGDQLISVIRDPLADDAVRNNAVQRLRVDFPNISENEVNEALASTVTVPEDASVIPSAPISEEDARQNAENLARERQQRQEENTRLQVADEVERRNNALRTMATWGTITRQYRDAEEEARESERVLTALGYDFDGNQLPPQPEAPESSEV